MSKKFFYNKVYNPRRRNTIIGISVGAGALVLGGTLILIYNHSNKVFTCDSPIIKQKEQINIEINSNFPTPQSYFNELQCVNEKKIKIDNSKIDITKLGEYSTFATIDDQSYEIKVNVVDNIAPDLKLKKVSINPGESYSYNDFVESCSDNSKEDCKIDFYSGETDENGNDIVYSEFKDVGNYDIKIVASDSSGNQSIVTGNLEIIEKSDEPSSIPEPEPEPVPEKCNYGNLEFDNSTYVLTLSVGNGDCAISNDEIQNELNKNKIVKIADSEANKIQEQVNKINGLSGTLTITKHITGIPNKVEEGYVGYELTIKITDEKANVIVSYKLKTDNTRLYIENPYNIN